MSFFLAAVATRCRWHPQSRLAAQVFARRLILLNRVNAAAMANAERFSDEAANFCDCEPDQWDHIEHQLNSTSDPVTKH
ncbi:hypothetical protein [Paraburkholderia sp. 2C]